MTPLSPTQKYLLPYLLSDRTLRTIAIEIGVPYENINSISKRIYKKYGVKNRYGFLCKFIDLAAEGKFDKQRSLNFNKTAAPKSKKEGAKKIQYHPREGCFSPKYRPAKHKGGSAHLLI